MISVVTMCKNRGGSRLHNCVSALLDSEIVSEIIVVDYGSKVPIEKGKDTPTDSRVKLIRYDKNPILNKAHALNLGIRESSESYIMTIDCDILVPLETLVTIEKHLRQDTFVINTSVRRINLEDVGKWEKAFPWYSQDNIVSKLNSRADGGMQVFPKKWIEKVHGYDENMILWGAMDNFLSYSAKLDGLVIVDLNSPIFHQEHTKKEENLPEEERKKATYIRKIKSKYMWNRLRNEDIINSEKWGENKPNQKKFLKYWNAFYESVSEDNKKREELIANIKKVAQNGSVPIKSVNVEWDDE